MFSSVCVCGIILFIHGAVHIILASRAELQFVFVTSIGVLLLGRMLCRNKSYIIAFDRLDHWQGEDGFFWLSCHKIRYMYEIYEEKHAHTHTYEVVFGPAPVAMLPDNV